MSKELIDQLLFWFALANAIGSLATFAAFVFLFRRDRNKEEQLSRLTGISQSQEGILEAMQSEIGELLKQTSLMRDANEIYSKQFELQTEVFHHQKLTSEQLVQLENQKQEIERKRRLSDIRPLFHKASATLNSSSIEQKFRNSGAIAHNVSIGETSGEIEVRPLPNAKDIKPGEDITISLYSSTVKDVRARIGTLDLRFFDLDGNEYSQTIHNEAHRGLWIDGGPRLIA
jgi:hypothetical protein